MNKKLIVTAVGLAMAGAVGLASADVKLYGQIDVSLDYTDSDVDNLAGANKIGEVAQNGQDYSDDINMESNTSAWGIKGSEDLGNGLSGFFKFEYQTDVTEGGGVSGRDQYLGLKMERFGKLTFGTTSTAYKSPGSKIDAFYRTPLEMRAIGLQSNLHSGKGEEGQGRGTNMVRYDSPSWNGLGLMATYQFDSNKQNQSASDCNATESCEDDDPYSLGIQYKGGNFYAAASYIDTQRSNDADAAQFLARYDWNDFSFHGIYELDGGLITAQANNGIGQNSDTTGNPAATTQGDFGRGGFAEDDGADIWSVGATYTIGNNLIGADYGQRSDSNGKNGVDDSNNVNPGDPYDDIQEYDVYRLAAYHKFSKRTRIYTGYAVTDYDDKGKDTLFTLGMRHNF